MNYYEKMSRMVRKLSHDQALELRSKLNDACIAYELGLEWRPIFQLMKNKYQVGTIHKLYSSLYSATPAQMNKVSLAMATPNFGDNDAKAP